MSLPDLELQPGQTVSIRITNHLTYRIHHTGWMLDVTSTKPIAVRPTSENSLTIISLGVGDDDEV